MVSRTSRTGALAYMAVTITLISCATARAQDYGRVAPNVPARTVTPSLLSPVAMPLESGTQPSVVGTLRGLVFVAGSERLVVTGMAVSAIGTSGIDVSQVPALSDERFTGQLVSFVGRSVTMADLDRIKAQTTAWLRAHQHPFVDVSIPSQNIASGVVQFVVTQYKLGQVSVKGGRYFSESFIKGTSGLLPGQTLALGDLQTDLDRLNRNPFLNVNAVFQPGANTGETDLTLDATDRLPLRVYSGFDNLGVRSLGTTEYNAGINWGNVFGTGQILSYQFTRTFTGQSASHSISDTVPLRWGDQLLIFGSYGEQRPLVAQIFNDQGHSGQASVRYVHPLPRRRNFTEDLQVGYDFKTTDNNLAFAGFQVFGGQAEVDQFPLVYDANLTERFGQTAVQNTFVYSPGGITANNTTAAQSTLVPGAKAHYIYDRFLITQTTPLPKEYSAITRVIVQGANNGLPYSEQVGGGGVGSVRGYYTDTALGSKGELFSQELRLPAFGVSRRVDRESGLVDKAQVGIFFDYANLRQAGIVSGAQSAVGLASTGFLARYSISRFLDVQYDMGWRLESAPTVPQRGAYGQVSLTGSF